MLKPTLLIALAWPAAGAAVEAPQSIGLHTVSQHSAAGYNGVNPGVYLHWANGLTLGAFRNSYEHDSAYAGWLWHIDHEHRFGVLFGAVTGYGSTTERMALAPLVAPSFRWGLGDGMSARVSWFADPRHGAVQVLHLSIEWSFDKRVSQRN